MESLHLQKPVNNFPASYPWYKKWGANITYYLSSIPLWPRKNALYSDDIASIYITIRTGDIILVWNFRHLSWLFIEWSVTHALVYMGRWKCIHAYAHGVSYIGIRKICRSYDTCIILRPRWRDDSQLMDFCTHIVSQLWKPYDFFFWTDQENTTFFCTRLINDSLQKVAYDSWFNSIREAKNIVDSLFDSSFRGHRILQPEEMAYGNFDVVFISHNIDCRDGKYRLISK